MDPKKQTQDLSPGIKEPIDRVGVENVRTHLTITRDGVPFIHLPLVDVFIDLKKDKKGIHMSRLIETINEVVSKRKSDPSLEQVRETLGDCKRCRLAEGRTHIVFGDGNPQADLVFVGEGPGETEDRRGLPFVGRAGELLTKMIEKGLGIPRSEVYICNVVKCRPPGNRTPLADEVAACSPFLDGQIAALKPRVIVALGKPAASLLLGRDVPITKVRGTWHDYHGIPLMPTFHPAYVLRRYTAENRRLVWEDLKAALARARAD